METHRPGDLAPALPLSPPSLEVPKVNNSGLAAELDALGPGLAGAHPLADLQPSSQ